MFRDRFTSEAHSLYERQLADVHSMLTYEEYKSYLDAFQKEALDSAKGIQSQPLLLSPPSPLHPSIIRWMRSRGWHISNDASQLEVRRESEVLVVSHLGRLFDDLMRVIRIITSQEEDQIAPISRYEFISRVKKTFFNIFDDYIDLFLWLKTSSQTLSSSSSYSSYSSLLALISATIEEKQRSHIFQRNLLPSLFLQCVKGVITVYGSLGLEHSLWSLPLTPQLLLHLFETKLSVINDETLERKLTLYSAHLALALKDHCEFTRIEGSSSSSSSSFSSFSSFSPSNLVLEFGFPLRGLHKPPSICELEVSLT